LYFDIRRQLLRLFFATDTSACPLPDLSVVIFAELRFHAFRVFSAAHLAALLSLSFLLSPIARFSRHFCRFHVSINITPIFRRFFDFLSIFDFLNISPKGQSAR